MKNRSNYPPDWFDVIRPAVLKRDHYKCQKCGIQHRSVYYVDNMGVYVIADEFVQQWAKKHGFRVFKVHLQVAHLNQDTKDNELSNLTALCPGCHLKYDSAVNVLKRIANRRKP